MDKNKKLQIAIESLQGMLIWSDRIGSDEISEIRFVVDLLKETFKNKNNGKEQ
tara:strand:+ start:2422 stop:2580 length:159 start_codon:yes stop_codon:yes gene_type:complete